MISKTLIFGVFAIAIAYLYTVFVDNGSDPKDEIEQSIIEAWNSSITEPKLKFRRISVGYVKFNVNDILHTEIG